MRAAIVAVHVGSVMMVSAPRPAVRDVRRETARHDRAVPRPAVVVREIVGVIHAVARIIAIVIDDVDVHVLDLRVGQNQNRVIIVVHGAPPHRDLAGNLLINRLVIRVERHGLHDLGI
jgi:hypothetical protein